MNEWDDLLKSLRSEQPRPSDIARWKAAVRRFHQHPSTRWLELVAATLVGVLIGGATFRTSPNDEIVGANATVEHVVTKIE